MLVSMAATERTGWVRQKVPQLISLGFCNGAEEQEWDYYQLKTVLVILQKLAAKVIDSDAAGRVLSCVP